MWSRIAGLGIFLCLLVPASIRAEPGEESISLQEVNRIGFDEAVAEFQGQRVVDLYVRVVGRFGSPIRNLGPQDFEIWQDACDTMQSCSKTFTQMMEERGLSGAVLYATPCMFLLSALTSGYFFVQQGLVAHEALESLKAADGVADDDLAKFVQSNSRAQFYDNKLKTLDFFLGVLLPRYQSYATPILNKNYTALDIAL